MKEQNNYIFTKEVKSLDAFALGQRIQDARICKGIKVLDMAAQLDLSKDQYSRIECGTSLASHFDLGHSSMAVIEFADEDFIIPKALQMSNDSHIFAAGISTDYSNRIHF